MATETDKLTVVDVQSWVRPDGPVWLLTTSDGFGIYVVWQSSYLIAWLSTTPFPQCWALDFGKSDNQVIAAYLPDEPDKTWAVAKAHLEKKFVFAKTPRAIIPKRSIGCVHG